MVLFRVSNLQRDPTKTPRTRIVQLTGTNNLFVEGDIGIDAPSIEVIDQVLGTHQCAFGQCPLDFFINFNDAKAILLTEFGGVSIQPDISREVALFTSDSESVAGQDFRSKATKVRTQVVFDRVATSTSNVIGVINPFTKTITASPGLPSQLSSKVTALDTPSLFVERTRSMDSSVIAAQNGSMGGSLLGKNTSAALGTALLIFTVVALGNRKN